MTQAAPIFELDGVGYTYSRKQVALDSISVTVAEGVRRYAEWIMSMPQPKEYFTQAEQTLKNMRIVRSAGKKGA